MNKEFPERTCTIERLITRPEDIQKVLEGRKTAQRRNGVYAFPGEMIRLKGHRFEVTALYRQTLGEMSDQNAREEGVPDKKTYLKHLEEIHPGIPWSAELKMWVHEFKRLPS
ncbi:hypothetical protein [Paludifilum halophilum]|uniref:ASCH domain-containing protein n=1 Tax=Paludifilum halophilum TaxID=1642702 RepID=A0A235B4C9_9BACL|nr:hypothetical protein [Paludifilum halophilum]OYD07091.1 hypothetical protein CHM34_11850 [Paludifilum halophilum]